jgi:hypothetical protein
MLAVRLFSLIALLGSAYQIALPSVQHESVSCSIDDGQDLQSAIPLLQSIDRPQPSLKHGDITLSSLVNPHLTAANTDNAASGPFSGKDCPVTVVVDPFFMNIYNNNQQEARTQVLNAFQQVDGIFKSDAQIGIPVKEVVFIDSNHPTLSKPTGDIDDLLKKIHDQVMSGSLAAHRYSCLIHYFTAQDYEGTIGNAFVKQDDGSGGMCDKFGYNIAATTFKSRGLYLSPVKIPRTIAHEEFHSTGSYHDGVTSPINTASCANTDNPYLMSPSVSTGSNGDDLSSCSINQINQKLIKNFSCFVPRNSVAYLQFQ